MFFYSFKFVQNIRKKNTFFCFTHKQQQNEEEDTKAKRKMNNNKTLSVEVKLMHAYLIECVLFYVFRDVFCFMFI